MSWHETYRKIISGERRGAIATVIRAILRSLAMLYGGVTAVRNLMFDMGLRQATKVDVPVISVGNLTTGGTGKTPMVASIVRMLQGVGRAPGILSRGYRADAHGMNDENRVLQHLCPGVPHVQNPDRIKGASRIINRHMVDSIVLDDGFQHRRIVRDLDLVLIDATNPFGYDDVLPRGLLRESIRSLRRAHMVVVTRGDQVSATRLTGVEERICSVAPQLRDRLLRVSFRPAGLLGIDGTTQLLSQIELRRVMVLAAIGNPESFENTCRGAGACVVHSQIYPDHYHYTRSDLCEVQSAAAEHQVDLVLTTVKDLVKIRLLGPETNGEQTVPVVALEIATVYDSPNGEQLLRSMIEHLLL
ncbi:MAG: tetraacyldisaccharide 4'-kinase [Planctomycetaceae bacterium]|jgi:tetraacyldisaccharide 4'-kinase